MELPNLKNAKRLAIDTETFDPHLFTKGPSVRTGGYIVGISVATDDNSWYFPINHDQGENLNIDSVISWAKDNFSTNCDKIFTNAMYDLDYLQHLGIKVNGNILDIQIAEPLIDESAKSYSLDALANKYLGVGKVDDALYEYCAIHFGGKPTRKQASNIWRCPPDVVSEYAKGDVELPLRIIDEQLKILNKEGLIDLFKMESSLIPLLLQMKKRGVKVDVDKAEIMKSELLVEIPKLQEKINKMCGVDVNVYSTASLSEAFNNIGLNYQKTDLGNPSFTSDFLSNIKHPIGQLITNIRHGKKICDTFIDGFVLDFHVNGRVHCSFNQLRGDNYGTVTGRFSASQPNLQQIPSDKEVRSLYIPETNEDWYTLDYSQIEYRIAAHYGSGASAEVVRSKYRENPLMDFHQTVADMVGIDRKPAKSINFGLLYGMGFAKLADELGITIQEAKDLRAKYHMETPFVKNLADKASGVAMDRGFVKTIMGRKRRFNLYESLRWEKGKFPKPYHQAVEEYGRVKRAYTYKALNSIVQGTSADIMKKSMVDVWKSGVCDVLGAPLLTVHDELDFSVPKTKEGQEAITEVKKIMENVFDLKVPIIVDVEKGNNWGYIKGVEL